MRNTLRAFDMQYSALQIQQEHVACLGCCVVFAVAKQQCVVQDIAKLCFIKAQGFREELDERACLLWPATFKSLDPDRWLISE